MATQRPFWQTKDFAAMTKAEWESLCDGCGRCCLVKYQDERSNDTYYTSIACRYLQSSNCRCQVYHCRSQKVADCIPLPQDRQAILAMDWLPTSCAYRLLAEKKSLAHWHPLVCGNAHSVQKAGISMAGKTVSEQRIKSQHWYKYIIARC
jgi:uncharacterized cysteine cluster protein YcgN (CxxCxxCC family)